MNTKLLLATLLACLCLVGAGNAAVHLPLVNAVGANTITVLGVTYQVPAGIRIEVDGLPSKLSDVHVGMIANIEQGLDRGTAESIVATTIPPPATAWKTKDHSLTRGVHANVVIAITDDRITFGAPGSKQAQAALITPTTRIYVAGARAQAFQISVGMPVDVVTVDGTHADAIRANDPNP